MRAEDALHDAAVAKLRQAEQEAIASGEDRLIRKARRAIAKEDAAYQSKKAALNDRRRGLLRKLNASERSTSARSEAR
jgi:hypothetical protein